MYQGTLALFNQTLRTHTRKLTMYIVMLFFVGCLLLMIVQGNFTANRFGAPGLRLFKMIVNVNFVFILLAGVSYFSSAITEEKEEGTLGLLRMTGMSPLVLLLGKSTSRFLFAVLFLTVQIPFVQLAVTMGGLKPPQIWAAYLVLASFLFFVANMGLYCSVVESSSRRAAIAMIAIGIAFSLLSTIASVCLSILILGLEGGTFGFISSFLWWPKMVIVAEPTFYCLKTVLSPGFNRMILISQILSNFVWGLLFFRMACTEFKKESTGGPLSTHHPITNYQALRVAPKKEEATKNKPKAPFLRQELARPWNQALWWKDFHFIAGGFMALKIKCLFYAGFMIFSLLIAITDQGNDMRGNLSGVVAGIGLFFLVVESAYLAGRLYRDEIRSNTWSTLVLLPNSFSSLIYGKSLGCCCSLGPSLLFILLGFLLAPDLHLRELFYDSAHFWRYVLLLVQFITFLHLVVYLSLVMQWGSLPISLFIFYVLSQLIRFWLFPGSGGASEAIIKMILTVTCIVICTLFHLAIRKRLKQLAAS